MESYNNDFYRFSTTGLQWKQLDASQVSGSPPIARTNHAMTALGSDLFIFGGGIDGQDSGERHTALDDQPLGDCAVPRVTRPGVARNGTPD